MAKLDKADKLATELRTLIKENEEYAIGTLMTLYKYQTLDEQSSKITTHQNSVGFNSVDAGFLSNLAQQYEKNGGLSDKQVSTMKPLLYKYCRQIVRLDGAQKLPNRWKEREPAEKYKRVGVSKKNPDMMIIEWAPFDRDTLEKVKSLPFRRFVKEKKWWKAPITLESIEKLIEWGFDLSPGLKKEHRDLKNPPKIKTLDIQGLKKGLFPFQKEGVEFIESRKGKALIGDEMGLGKTVQSLAWLQYHPERRPVVIVVPASVKFNWLKEATAWMEHPNAMVLAGKKGHPILDKNMEIFVINYDILSGWVEHLKALDPKVVILDECFPAGTKISTPNGPKNIEDIEEGEEVKNATGTGRVIKKNQRHPTHLLKLHLANGQSITTTPNHPFFTKHGWLRAEDLLWETLLSSSEIFNILSNNNIFQNQEEEDETKEMQMVQNPLHHPHRELPKTTILRNILLREVEDVSTFDQKEDIHQYTQKEMLRRTKESPPRESRVGETDLKTNEGEQSVKTNRSKKEDQKTLEGIWTPNTEATTKRRKRTTTPESTENTLCCSRRELESRIPNPNKEKKRIRISNQLQSRPSPPEDKNLDRSRRMDPQHKTTKKTRPKKRIRPNRTRVERIEILQQKSGKEPYGCDVYNLQVSGHPSYFAEGFLVHNCHYIKNRKAQRTKAVQKLCKGVDHVIGLSGTPIINRPIEFFNVLNILSPRRFPSFWKYAQEFCGARHNGFGWDFTGSSNTGKLHDILTKSVMIRRMKGEVLKDLPEKMRTVVPMELTNRKQYQSIENAFREWVNSDLRKEMMKDPESRPQLQGEALTHIEKMKQLCLDGKLKGSIHWIDDYLESTDKKIVLFCTHQRTVDHLSEHYGRMGVVLDGRVPVQSRPYIIEKFQEDPEVRVFIGNLKAAGIGITLTAADTTCFLELGWTPGEHDQAEDRVHRIGQESDSVNAYYLVCPGTIEDTIVEILDQKRRVLSQVLDGKDVEEGTMLTELIGRYEV